MSFVIRGRYCQPDGVGWVTKDGAVTCNPRDAQVFESEADAWTYLSSTDLTGQDERGPYAWPEPHREYTREEVNAILDEHDRAEDAYYGRRGE